MAPKKREKAEAPAPEPAEDYSSLSAPKLKERLKALGASTGGSKEILVERLKTLEACAAASASSEPAAKRGKAAAPEPEPKAAARGKATAAAPEPESKAAARGKAKAAPPEPQPKATASRSAPPSAKEEPAKPAPRAKAKAEPERVAPKAEAKAAAKADAKGKKRDAEGQQKAEEPAGPPAKLTAPSQVFFEAGEFKVDYAKSDKSECNTCKNKIQKGTVRLGKMVKSTKFDGMYPQWSHATCFFMAGLLPICREMIDGLSMLATADQDEIKKHVPSSSASSDRGDSKADKEMQKQNKKIFEVQEMLTELKDAQLKEMLDLNGYPTKKLQVGLKEVCADGIVFGACGHCEACGDSERNIFLLAGDAYTCRGWVDEFLKCTNRTQKPERTTWKLTEAAKQVADGKLAKMKLTTGTRLFATALTDVLPTTSIGSVKDTLKKPTFSGQVIVLSRHEPDSSQGSLREDLTKLVRENGGMLADTVTKATSFVVSLTGQTEGEDEAKAAELRVPGVRYAFLQDSAEKGDLQDMETYLLWGEARRRREVEEKTTSHFKEKRGVKLDTDVDNCDCGKLSETSHVLVDRQARVVYSEMMTKTDVDSGANSFYTIHLLESDDLQSSGDRHYHIFRKWGRIGSTQGGTKLQPFEGNKSKAIEAFKKVYYDQTCNTFGHKPDEFAPKHGKMLRVALEHKALCKGFQESSGGEASVEEDAGNNDQPLGKLSKDQILKGDAVLDKIEALLNEEGGATGPLAANKFKSLTNQYYMMIPHNTGAETGPILNNETVLGQEKALLQFYLRMGFEEVGEPDEQLAPIAGVMQLELPKTLLEAATGICPAGPVKQCTNKGTQLAKKKAGKPLQEMGADLYGAILLYTSNAIYKQLNKALRDEDRNVVQNYFKYLRMLFEACGRLETKTKTLWRGIGVDLFPTYKVGSTVIWWGVSSCTSNQKVARDFMAGCGEGATFLTIETTTACDIAEVSFYANEAESLLLPGTQLEVMRSERKGKQSEIWLREVGRVVN